MRKIWAGNYLANRPLEEAVAAFGARWQPEQRLLDIGCGQKPYQKYFRCQYVGADYNDTYHPDIVAPAWDLPVPDASFDVALILQALEHISQTEQTIAELHRVLKPGGMAFITVPQTMKNHSGLHDSHTAPVHNFSHVDEPYWRVDYYRFTKYGLIYLCRDFQIVSIAETTGYVGTLLQLVNYFFIEIRRGHLFLPIYLCTNILGVICDRLAARTQHSRFPLLRRFYHSLYSSLTTNYVLIIQKPMETRASGTNR